MNITDRSSVIFGNKIDRKTLKKDLRSAKEIP